MEPFLDYKFPSSDLYKTVTVRQFLQELLLTLFREGEGFSGKRPLGNSGWTADLVKAAIRGGFCSGTLDEDGYLDFVDEKAFEALMARCIRAL